MIFHLPGNERSLTGSNADTPFSSCWLNPGFTPTTLNAAIFCLPVFMNALLVRCAGGSGAPADANASYGRDARAIIQFDCSYRLISLGLSTRATAPRMAVVSRC